MKCRILQLELSSGVHRKMEEQVGGCALGLQLMRKTRVKIESRSGYRYDPKQENHEILVETKAWCADHRGFQLVQV